MQALRRRRAQWTQQLPPRFRHFTLSARLRDISSKQQPSAIALPQYNIKHLVANQDLYIRSCNVRRLPNVSNTVPVIAQLYGKTNTLRKDRTTVYTQRKALQNQLHIAKDKTRILEQLGKLKDAGNAVDTEIEELERKIRDYMDRVPNLIPEDCPLDEERVVKYICPPPSDPAELKRNDDEFIQPIDFDDKTLADHVDIGVQLGIIDLMTASKVSGHAFYYLIGDGAVLEQALVHYALDKARRRGFKMMIPPSVVRREFAHACGFRPRDTNGEQQIYNITIAGGELGSGDEGRLCLAGTAEIPLAAWASDKSFDVKECPVKMVGVSRSYRAEAGSRGRDTRGIYRVHEFTKVELFSWVPGPTEETPEGAPTSADMLEELRELQEDIISGLGLHARVLDMPGADLGASAYKKYDIEAWMPGRQNWGEITSASNCTDYQSRRLHTRVKVDGRTLTFAHTLNGTAMAVPRAIVAILENYYDPERKAVWIPKPLRKYFDNRAWIEQQ
ncbi:hypothetical protein V1508DRAFT_410832 [Lipomyces doorenjongii]|uniref:uncharacterized protein n=1 Tax=Lipomyces doorenjongii TaxID=383834 RepID=UPI0034CEB526